MTERNANDFCRCAAKAITAWNVLIMVDSAAIRSIPRNAPTDPEEPLSRAKLG